MTDPADTRALIAAANAVAVENGWERDRTTPPRSITHRRYYRNLIRSEMDPMKDDGWLEMDVHIHRNRATFIVDSIAVPDLRARLRDTHLVETAARSNEENKRDFPPYGSDFHVGQIGTCIGPAAMKRGRLLPAMTEWLPIIAAEHDRLIEEKYA